MKLGPTIFAMALGTILHAAPATACRDPGNQRPFFYEQVPTEGLGDFVALVQITATENHDVAPVPAREARIIRAVRGKWRGKKVRTTETLWTSCNIYPEIGETGILVGKIVRVDDHEIVIDLIRPPSLRERERLSRVK